MSYRFDRRFVVVVAMVVAAAFSSACKSGDITEPVKAQQAPTHRAAHDDDPATCRNGYTIMDGHVYCNPI